MTKRTRNRNRERKMKPVTLALASQWDMGATGPANQERLVTEPATDIDPETSRETPNPNGIRRRRREAMIVLLWRSRHITDAQATAAARLWMASRGRQERDPLAALTGHAPIRGEADPQAAMIDARREFLAMWHRIPMSSRPVVERVVIEDQAIWDGNSAMRERHMQRLKVGLDAIA